MRDPIDITLEIEHETNAALLVTDGVLSKWIPKSQIDYPEAAEIGGTYTITMPEWLAEDKGFI